MRCGLPGRDRISPWMAKASVQGRIHSVSRPGKPQRMPAPIPATTTTRKSQPRPNTYAVIKTIIRMPHNLVALVQALYHFNQKTIRLTNRHVLLQHPFAVDDEHRVLSVLAKYRRRRNHQHVIATPENEMGVDAITITEQRPLFPW